VDKKQKKKLKRAAKKKKETAIAREAQHKINKQMGMFDKLPGECSACKKHFPKTQEAHNTWRVVVKYDKQQVRLFCPSCQELASNLAESNNEV